VEEHIDLGVVVVGERTEYESETVHGKERTQIVNFTATSATGFSFMAQVPQRENFDSLKPGKKYVVRLVPAEQAL
jgi:hypothetical protein